MAATWLLPEAVGITRAREMLYTGRQVAPALALEWGLVNDTADDALQHALAMAERIAQAAPIALRLTKNGLEQAAGGLEASLQWEALAQPVTLTTSDLHESITAFHEQRPPQFRGR
ncbi:enoyl-CoA hydratase-related protein [Spirillospora sp. NPDC029432]